MANTLCLYNPLNYSLLFAKLNASGLPWLDDISNFKFTIIYWPGTVNHDADTLSRLPVNFESYIDSCMRELSIAEQEGSKWYRYC